jgi:lipopolysaccharide export system protein LptA
MTTRMLKRLNFAVFLFLALLPSAFSADTFTFRADKMAGGKGSGRETTVLSGNAQVRTDDLELHAERIEIRGSNNDIIDCTGAVWGMQEEKGIYFRTDALIYDRKTKIAKLSGNSTLEDRENEVVARGRYIEYDDEREIAVFQIAVRLYKDKMVCRSEYAIYRRVAKMLDLSGYPKVFKDNDEFEADRIRVDIDTNDVVMDGDISGVIRGSS